MEVETCRFCGHARCVACGGCGEHQIMALVDGEMVPLCNAECAYAARDALGARSPDYTGCRESNVEWLMRANFGPITAADLCGLIDNEQCSPLCLFGIEIECICRCGGKYHGHAREWWIVEATQ